MYLSVSGGYGQWYDVMFALVARVTRSPAVYHHHTHMYLTRKRLATACLLRVAGKQSVHVVLCRSMGDRLRNLYGDVAQTVVVSNAAILQPLVSMSDRRSVGCVGFLGNISTGKGIREFFGLCRALQRTHPRLNVVVAGPFEDYQLRDYVFTTLQDLHGTYLGPVYGQAKSAFYSQVDVLIFPSRLKEGEPLTILEALASGIPVVAREAGCAQSTVVEGGGVAEPTDRHFKQALERLETWADDDRQYQQASTRSQLAFGTLRQSGLAALREAIDCAVKADGWSRIAP